MDVCSPEFFDVWRDVVVREQWTVRHMAHVRAVCRMLRAIVDAHARIDLHLRRQDDERFYSALRPRRSDAIVPRADGLPANAFPIVALPSNLRSLTFNLRFNHVVDWSALPRALEVLVFGVFFDQVVDAERLPPNLKELAFGKHFRQALRGPELPRSLTKLRLRSWFYRWQHCPWSYGDVPPALTDVTLGASDRWMTLQTSPLPTTVHTVRVVGTVNIKDGSIPATTRHLVLGKRCSGHVAGSALPASLRSLSFRGRWGTWPVVGYLPATLTSLSLGDRYVGELRCEALPRALLSLRVGNSFRKYFETDTLPRTLTELRLGYRFCQAISEYGLPPGLTRLDVGTPMHELLRVERLPRSLTDLREVPTEDVP